MLFSLYKNLKLQKKQHSRQFPPLFYTPHSPTAAVCIHRWQPPPLDFVLSWPLRWRSKLQGYVHKTRDARFNHSFAPDKNLTMASGATPSQSPSALSRWGTDSTPSRILTLQSVSSRACMNPQIASLPLYADRLVPSLLPHTTGVGGFYGRRCGALPSISGKRTASSILATPRRENRPGAG